jgi:hypothetical protein
MRNHSDLVSTALAAAALAAAILLSPWGARAHSDSPGPHAESLAAAEAPSVCTPGTPTTQTRCVAAGKPDRKLSRAATRTGALSHPF